MISIDDCIHDAIFLSADEAKKQAGNTIRSIALKQGIFPASIRNLYSAFGRNSIQGFTVPACNVRTLTYEFGRLIFRLIMRHNISPFIFEIAPTEQTYTNQTPDEYALCIIAAAIKENYQGPIFLQGDHYQFSKKRFDENKNQEIERIQTLIDYSIKAGFYNIDIDASTLVDLTQKDVTLQQKNNYEMTSFLIRYIRKNQSKNISISIGGEIGHIGGKNSTIEDLKCFMNGLNATKNELSKISIQTGTSHGGIMGSNGKIVDVMLDFDLIEEMGRVARNDFNLGGVVQHGASTLPDDLFHRFTNAHTLEVHLATGFQNIIYDHMPKTVRDDMYVWLKNNCVSEKKEDMTDEQFFYATRKKAFGPFKKILWELDEKDKKPILDALEKKLLFYSQQFNLFDKKKIVDTIVLPL